MQRSELLLTVLHQRLGAGGQAALQALAAAAQRHGSPLYLVGGSVRDLLLARDHVDLDFVVETEAPAVARSFARGRQARVVIHDRFRTATVLEAALSFDLVTARRETYPEPGALPVVTPATLADDLARRDFTVNALALTLSGPRAGALVDPYGGQRDLRQRRLRVLHDQSFVDDPTRLWRAGRYQSRFRLRLDPETEVAARLGLPFLERVSAARIGHELARTLAEPAPERALSYLDDLGVLAATLPGLRCSRAIRSAAAIARELAPEDAGTACLATLLVPWSAARIEQGALRLALSHRQGQALRALPALRATMRLLLRRGASAGGIALELERFPEAAIAAFAGRARRSAGGAAAARYLREWKSVRPVLNARALLAAGLQPGPLLGELSRALRAARIDGRAVSLDDERRLVDTMLARRGFAPAHWPEPTAEGAP